MIAQLKRSVRGMKRMREDKLVTPAQRETIEKTVAEMPDGLIEVRCGTYIGQPETPYVVSLNGGIYTTVYKSGFSR